MSMWMLSVIKTKYRLILLKSVLVVRVLKLYILNVCLCNANM